MRIVTQNGLPVERASSDKTVEAAAPAAPLAPAEAPALASSVLAPAKAELAAMPEIDQAKVDALREALARGEISFDAERLAGLIQRFHGE